MWPSGAEGLHRGSPVKMRSLGWALMTSVLLKWGRCGHRDPWKEDDVQRKEPSTHPGEPCNSSLPQPPGEPTLPRPRFWASSLQTAGTRSVLCAVLWEAPCGSSPRKPKPRAMAGKHQGSTAAWPCDVGAAVFLPGQTAVRLETGLCDHRHSSKEAKRAGRAQRRALTSQG